MGGGRLGGSGGLEHGSLEAMEAPCGDMTPLGFCKGEVGWKGPYKPFPARRVGVEVFTGRGLGAVVGTFLSHFLLLWVLPLPPLTHPTPRFARSASAASQGAGVPGWNHVSRKAG